MKILLCIVFFSSATQINAREHFLSFVIPCYNCAATIEQAVSSVYAQKNLPCDFELVCTDDGSKDATYQILMQLAKQYSNMRVFKHAQNKGGAAARNTSVRNSSGDLIFNLDSDNYLEPNSVALLIEKLDAEGFDCVAFEKLRFFGTREPGREPVFVVPAQGYFDVTVFESGQSMPGVSGNYLFTRESYDRAGGYIEGLGALDTFSFGFAQMATGSKMGVASDTFYWHRDDGKGYVLREIAHGRFYSQFIEVFKHFGELFTHDTNKMLEAYSGPDGHSEIYARGRLRLIPSPARECVMQGYAYENMKMLIEALASYKQAYHYLQRRHARLEQRIRNVQRKIYAKKDGTYEE